MTRWLSIKLLAIVAVAIAGAGFNTVARAETIQLGSTSPATQYFHDGVLVRPASFEVNDFIAMVAGTVTVSVQRIEWGDLFSQLSSTIALANKPDLLFNGNATTAFDLVAGESFTTSIFAQTSGALGYGAYRLDVLFLPSVTQVPLPPGGWLLLSGLGMLAYLARRRRGALAIA